MDSPLAGNVTEVFRLHPECFDKDVYKELTERENDVLCWIALGASNKEIANKLGISEKTVKNHLSNVFQKLHVQSRTQAALYVFSKKQL